MPLHDDEMKRETQILKSELDVAQRRCLNPVLKHRGIVQNFLLLQEFKLHMYLL